MFFPPRKYGKIPYLSKGFYPPTDIHDFPIRNKRLILRLRRRRRQDKSTGLPFMRDLLLVASGTHLTPEFAAFLKELSLQRAYQ